MRAVAGADLAARAGSRLAASGTALAWITIPRGEALAGILGAIEAALPRTVPSSSASTTSR